MTEWSVVLVIVTLVGVIAAVVTPVAKLTGTLSSLQTTLASLQQFVTEERDSNSRAHERLWNKNTEQDTLLQLHATEIARHDADLKHLKGERE